MALTPVFPADAPEPIGPYSPALWDDSSGLLFISGQAPIDPETGALVQGETMVQARQVFTNLEAVLSWAGLTVADVVKVTIYLTAMSDFARMNVIYAEVFRPPYPARATVAVAELPLGAKILIDVIASRPRPTA